MFEKGELVVYGRTGICKVTDITTMQIEGVDKNKLYYLLTPLKDKGGKIFTPVKSERVAMRKVLTRDEASQLIEEIPGIEELGIDNDKMRESVYKEGMKSGNCREWVKIIKTLYVRKQKRIIDGKKTTSTDEKYLRMAEESLYSELSLSLDIPESEMVEYITDKCSNSPVEEGSSDGEPVKITLEN